MCQTKSEKAAGRKCSAQRGSSQNNEKIGQQCKKKSKKTWDIWLAGVGVHTGLNYSELKGPHIASETILSVLINS